MSDNNTDPAEESIDLGPLPADEVRKSSIFYERLDALERDVLLVVAAVGDRGDPRRGATVLQVSDALTWLYDDKRISRSSVEDVLEGLVEADLVSQPEANRFRATLEAGGSVDHYLERIGTLWSDKIPEEDGAKTVIERRVLLDPDTVRGADYAEEDA